MLKWFGYDAREADLNAKDEPYDFLLAELRSLECMVGCLMAHVAATDGFDRSALAGGLRAMAEGLAPNSVGRARLLTHADKIDPPARRPLSVVPDSRPN